MKNILTIIEEREKLKTNRERKTLGTISIASAFNAEITAALMIV